MVIDKRINVGMVERAQGCLLGQLAGDSLGQLVEFTTPQAIRNNYPAGCRDLADGGTWDLLAGQPTDDSELALMLARTLVQKGRYDEQASLAAYRHWINSGPFDVGGTTRRALAYNQPDPNSQANGSLMRISPLGIFGAGRPAQAAEWARQDGRLTHPHPICQDCCGLFVAAIATAIETGCSPQECYDAALTETERSNANLNVRLLLAGAKDAPPAEYLHHMGWVIIAFQNAFYQLLHAPNLEESIVDTVMRGGDTDTNAAIAGTLLGAVHGRQQVPQRWVDALLACRPEPGTATAHPRPREFWPIDALELAEELLKAGKGVDDAE